MTKTDNFDLANDIAVMLDLLSIPGKDYFVPNIELTLKLVKAVLQYFFLCIAEEGNLYIVTLSYIIIPDNIDIDFQIL